MPRQGRVRWKRFTLIFLPSAAVASAMLYASVENAIATSLVVSGETLKVSADEVRLWGVSQFDLTLKTKEGEPIPVHVIAAQRSESFNVCQSYIVHTPFGTATFKTFLGTPDRPVIARNQAAYARRVDNGGGPHVKNQRFGVDASTAETVPGLAGLPGNPGELDDMLVVRNTRQQLVLTTAEDLDVPTSTLRIDFGVHECF
ncbi:DUF6230 family protein [Sphaerisporangium fuscum]|uniref:DUF6230 family protein n=1 Tax=Sphaerisporangium fuscum TaxID=2835868 RepID=UPI001BDBF991|nr:DUF6230 family protein [Sphaerisporangium fuscum]